MTLYIYLQHWLCIIMNSQDVCNIILCQLIHVFGISEITQVKPWENLQLKYTNNNNYNDNIMGDKLLLNFGAKFQP